LFSFTEHVLNGLSKRRR